MTHFTQIRLTSAQKTREKIRPSQTWTKLSKIRIECGNLTTYKSVADSEGNASMIGSDLCVGGQMTGRIRSRETHRNGNQSVAMAQKHFNDSI